MSADEPPVLDDRELVRRAQAGELAAFETLAGRHERRVYALALRILRHEHDAEDVTQQAFLSAVEHLGEFRGESSFGTWLLRIATHAALKVIRKRKGLDVVSLDEALEELDEKHRLVFLLRDVEGLSVRETAETLGLSEVNVKVRLLRARLQLRERLTQAFGDPAHRLAPHRHDGA